MPGRIVEVDEQRGRHAEAHGRHVIVLDRQAVAQEVAAVAETRGGLPHDLGEPAGRVRLAPDVQIAVADHVHEDHGARQLLGLRQPDGTPAIFFSSPTTYSRARWPPGVPATRGPMATSRSTCVSAAAPSNFGWAAPPPAPSTSASSASAASPCRLTARPRAA